MTDAIDVLYKHFLTNPRISTDSRNIIPQSLFFALKGRSFNGNNFALTALEKGAVLAVVDEDIPGINKEKTFRVENVLHALQLLAHHHRKVLQTPILAITGTNGKTTTKELLHAVLSESYNCYATRGNLNNHIGVPLSLLELTSAHRFAVIEMGANHIGEIHALCQIAAPDYGLITNIGKAHMEGFGSLEGVKKAKAELYDFIDKKNGSIFFNNNDTILQDIVKVYSCKKIAYGNAPGATVSAKVDEASSFLSLELLFSSGISVKIQSQLIGSYNADNILAAACVGAQLNVPEEKICRAIEKYTPANHRSQYLKTQNNSLILDLYNANPSSMEAAVKNFIHSRAKNKMLILGDMLELGDMALTEHEYLLKMLMEAGLKKVYLVGDNFRKAITTTGYDYPVFPDVFALNKYIKNNPPHGAYIMLKGSRGMKLEEVVELL